MTSIVNSILKIVEYLFGWLYNKSNNKTITNNQNAKKLQERKDENRKIIEDAQTNPESLEELRKRCSK